MADTFQVGDRVKIATLPPYLKSDQNMPMLRPPDLVEVGEEGVVRSRKPGGYLGVKFENGAFLIDAQYLEASGQASGASSEETNS
ncbi:MAG: regulatory protein SipA [Phormidesmis sp.]